MASSTTYPPLADYALIGDCHTAALIARDGSIDWFCPVRFDASAVFCRLLDTDKGGYLRTAPTEPCSTERRYIEHTSVLETTFSTSSGRVRLTDLMPIHRRQQHRQGYDVGTSRRVLRRVEGLEGTCELELAFKPSFDFARAATQLEVRGDRGVVAHADGSYLTLTCPGFRLRPDAHGVARVRLRVEAGQSEWIVLTCTDELSDAEQALAPFDCDQQLAATVEYWQRWAEACTYQGSYREQVVRSALVLKLLTYEPTGALVAAPTTSLPESIGGERNWDYRFTWLRDSALIVYALTTIGYADESTDFMRWLEQTIHADPTTRPQVMYGIDGRTDLSESALQHLEGYRGSRPVRIGNAAATQEQLDIYGEVLRAAYLHYRRDPDRQQATPRPDEQAWRLLCYLVDEAAAHWQEAGRGMWEMRSEPRHFLYGKLMCWAALDAGIRLAHDHYLEAPLEKWQRTREEIRAAILDKGFDRQLGAFTQAFGSSTLDATALVIPRCGFLPPTDPRVLSTVEQIQTRLMQDGLVYRYRTSDGLPDDEGTFTLCTFWLVDALALANRLDEARSLFEQMLARANDLGLFAEEIDPASGQQLGNFPQGFSHMALIGAAVNLARAEAANL